MDANRRRTKRQHSASRAAGLREMVDGLGVSKQQACSRHNYTLGQAVRAAWDAASAERRVAPRELQIADDVDLLVSTMNDSNKGLMKVAIRHQMTKLRELAAAPAEHSLRAAPLTPMRRPTS
jgi:hypothetical protein